MRNKNIIATLLLFLCFLSLYSQDYYWYDGNKLKLTIDSTKLNVTITNKHRETELNLQAILNKYATSLKLNRVEETSDYKMFSIGLESSKIYNDIVTLLKSSSSIVTISPYFMKSENSSIGTSSFFYVQLRDTNDYEKLKQFSEKMNLDIIKQVPNIPDWYILSVTSNSKFNSVEASNIAYESGLFVAVDPAFMFDFKVNCANDTYFYQLWGLKNNTYPDIDINVCDAWSITQGNGINVAVVDQGIDKMHNDLAANISPLSFDMATGTSPSSYHKYFSHGTHVAGIIAAVKNNNLQVVGVAPESKIMSVSLNNTHVYSLISSQYASGIQWSWETAQASVINNSWGDQGGYFYNQFHSTILEGSITNALTQGRNGKGCVVVFASGNQGSSSNLIDYPGNFHNDILIVGSISSNGIRATTSSNGDKLDVVAPGVNILSTISNNYEDYMSGTSAAAPHVSGVAALILSVNPDLTQKQVADVIESTAQKVGNYNYANSTAHPNGTWNNEMGHGLVDAYAAVKKAKDMYCPSTTLAGTQPPPPSTSKRVVCKEIKLQNVTVPSGTSLKLKATGGAITIDANTRFRVEAGARFTVE